MLCLPPDNDYRSDSGDYEDQANGEEKDREKDADYSIVSVIHGDPLLGKSTVNIGNVFVRRPL